MVDKIKILTSLMSLFQPIKFVVAKSYFVYCNYVSSCIVNMKLLKILGPNKERKYLSQIKCCMPPTHSIQYCVNLFFL